MYACGGQRTPFGSPSQDFHCVSSRDPTRVFRPGSKLLFPLNHLNRPLAISLATTPTTCHGILQTSSLINGLGEWFPNRLLKRVAGANLRSCLWLMIQRARLGAGTLRPEGEGTEAPATLIRSTHIWPCDDLVSGRSFPEPL